MNIYATRFYVLLFIFWKFVRSSLWGIKTIRLDNFQLYEVFSYAASSIWTCQSPRIMSVAFAYTYNTTIDSQVYNFSHDVLDLSCEKWRNDLICQPENRNHHLLVCIILNLFEYMSFLFFKFCIESNKSLVWRYKSRIKVKMLEWFRFIIGSYTYIN